MGKSWSEVKKVFIQKLNSILLKICEILKKHQECFLNIGLSAFFIEIGFCGYLLFMHPVHIEEVNTPFMSIQKVTGIIEHVDIQQNYDNKESRFILRFFPKFPFNEDITLSLGFFETLSSVTSGDIKFTPPDKLNNISLTIPVSKTKRMYAIEFLSPVMKHISNEYLQCPISVSFRDGKKFPVKYCCFLPSMTRCDVTPVKYVPEQKSSSIYKEWSDVVVARPNDASMIEPIRLRITNPVIVDRAESRRTLGMIIMSLAASFIANILYDLKNYVTKIQ